jgi:pimeloyl-ACP methyl ester carboxylesterase
MHPIRFAVATAVTAIFGWFVMAASASPSASALVALDPFLVAPDHLDDMKLAAFLAGNPQLSSYAANALSADGTSAAILLFESGSGASVTFQTNDAASLVAYADNFLSTPPATGQSSLTVSSLIQIGSTYFAPVLVQGPLEGYSSNNVISISASQGGDKESVRVPLVIPPLVLVHGLWGGKKSLVEAEKYLRANPPWSSAPEFVEPICYSIYLRFDAKKDPLSGNHDPCEVTSRSALQTEIDSLLASLDSDHVVGARVDLLVHSMGGLVARNYASQRRYVSIRNRKQGQFHAIVTLNTPEIGSELAPFLIAKRDAKRKAPLSTFQGLAWEAVCGNVDLSKCLAANGDPINAPTLPVKTGAVYSLDPDGPALNNPDLSGPNIANATWRAVSSKRPGNSALAVGVDTLIAALYHNPEGKNVPTVDSILGNQADDAIVTVASQTNGAAGNQLYTFAKLSHTSLPESILEWLTGVDDNSVVHDPSREVEKLAACWIETTGADSCVPRRMEITEIPLAPVARHLLRPLSGMLVEAPLRATLGSPFEAVLRLPSTLVPATISAWQQGETAHLPPEAIVPVSAANGAVSLRVTPKILGPVEFGFRVEFADGSVAARTFRIFVAPPVSQPLAFNANDLPVLVLTLNSETASAMPQPSALYPPPVGRIDLNTRFVKWRLSPEQGAPVIRVDRDGLIDALRPGEARVQARFGAASATLRVIVRATQQ